MTLTYIFHAGDLNNWYARFLSDVKPGETIYSEEFFAERSGKAERDEEIDPIAHEKQYLGELKEFTDAKAIPFWKITREGETFSII